MTVGDGAADKSCHGPRQEYASSSQPHLNRLRTEELSAVRSRMASGRRLLEIGGGTGWQAALLQSQGFVVSSVDIDVSRADHYRVIPYDGWQLPFRSRSFDVVFSSNVLEHVELLPQLLADSRRVLKSGGVMVHIVPTPTWRIATSATWYVRRVFQALGMVAQWLLRRDDGSEERFASRNPPSSTRSLLSRVLLPGPHGEFGSAWAEIRAFSRKAWLRRFENASLVVIDDFGTRLLYSGSELLPRLDLRTRRLLARILGSSTRAYVVV